MRDVKAGTTLPDDAMLLRRVCEADDKVAFDALYDKYRNYIYRFCYGWLRDAADAAEAAQDSFLRLYRHASSWRGDASVKTYLVRIAWNVCRDMWEKRRVEMEWGEELEKHSPERVASSIKQNQISAVFWQEISMAVEALGEKCRWLLRLKYLEEMTNTEIATVGQTSLATVKRQHRRCLELLAAKVGGIR